MYQNETMFKLQAAINAAWNNDYSDLYQTHWRLAGITVCPTIADITDLQQLPPVTKAVFVAARTQGIHIFVPPQKLSLLNSSSGSTSGEPFFVWLHEYAISFYRTLQQWGTKRMFLIWNYTTTPLWASSIRSSGIEVMSIDPHQLSYCEELLQTETFDTLAASPSIATMLPQHLKNMKLLEQFKVLDLGGEALTPTTLQLLKQQYPMAQIFNHFGSIESSGAFGFHTPACGEDYTIMHINDEDFVVDIDSTNEIAITILNPPLYPLPLIRYQTGDSGILLKEPCVCGLDKPRFKITGRSGVDFVRVRGTELRIEYLQAALAVFSTELKPVIHVIVREIRTGDRIVALLDITLVLCDGIKDTSSLRERILSALDAVQISHRVTLKQAIEAGLFNPPRLYFDTTYEVKDKNKSIKLEF